MVLELQDIEIRKLNRSKCCLMFIILNPESFSDRLDLSFPKFSVKVWTRILANHIINHIIKSFRLPPYLQETLICTF